MPRVSRNIVDQSIALQHQQKCCSYGFAFCWRLVGFEHLHNLQVKMFNGTKIKTLKHLKELVEQSKEEFWR